MGSFWKNIAKGLVAVGRGALATADWASQHPEVITLIKNFIETLVTRQATNKAVADAAPK